MGRRWTCATVVLLTLGAVCAPVVRGQPAETPGSDAGLRGEYFNNWWRGGTPAVTRTDPQIDFDWGDGPPAPGVNADFFSVRWTGDLKAPVTDTYTFTVQPEAFIILRIADRTLIGERWASVRGGEGQIALVGERAYPIELIYEAGKSETAVQLLWETSTRPQEVVPAQVFQLPLRARAPSPADEAVDVVQNTTLTWTAGCRATLHDIYFGTDANAVADATPATVGIYRCRQSGSLTEFDPGPLDWNRTWYWRVDEVNEAEPGSPWKGPVWSFTTADFLLLDDFESYTDDEYSKRIYEVWIDGYLNGTGSLVGYLDTGYHPNVVHGGWQAMPLEYNNVGAPYYSRVTRTWDVPQDWTVNHVADLSLWVHGWPVAFAEKSDGQIVLSGAGWDANTGEGFRYAYKELPGDGEIVARVDSFGSPAGWAGVMVRETGERWHEPPAVKFAALVVTSGEGVCFMYRRAADEQKERHSVAGVQAPCWVKLIRRGDTFTAQFSTKGTGWQDVTDSSGTALAAIIPMPEPAYVGLCVTSDAWDSPGIAEFSQVSLIGSSAEPWQEAAINMWGADWGNTPAALYVALEDTKGWRAVAVNRDAVNVNEWTQWRIPLSEFGNWGVNLKAIKTMYIDIGDKNCPQPDGGGRIYIDDICLLPRAQAVALSPADGDVNVSPTPVLQWSPGGMGTHSDIYFGTDPDAVANATPVTAGIYRERQGRRWEEMRYEPGELEWNRTYWWRADEVDAAHPESPWKGPVWRFTTADFLAIDDFEDWPGQDWCDIGPCPTWIDGYLDGRSGSLIGNPDPPFAEQAIVHGGRLSLPVDYNNVDKPFYSEIWREYRLVHDWTINGGDTLVLFVHGLATNDPAPVYVSISARKTVWVFHPDPQLARATQWTEWRIPLSTLPGIDPANVEVIRIGVGDSRDPTPGGRGRIYLDDIGIIKSTP